MLILVVKNLYVNNYSILVTHTNFNKIVINNYQVYKQLSNFCLSI